MDMEKTTMTPKLSSLTPTDKIRLAAELDDDKPMLMFAHDGSFTLDYFVKGEQFMRRKHRYDLSYDASNPSRQKRNMTTITNETTAEQAAEILNAAAVAQCDNHADDNDAAVAALWDVLPDGTETVEERECGTLVKLPTGQTLRLFEVAYSKSGIVPGGLGLDAYADNSDEMGGLK